MTEPVAYIQIKDGKAYSVLRKGTPNDEYTPVYTAEQLHPRVKMTQAEFDEWKELYYETTDSSLTANKMLTLIFDNTFNGRRKYNKLAKRVYQDDDFMTVSKNQSELVSLLINYSPDNPDKTIEITHDVKWFVVAKEPDINGKYSSIDSLNIDIIYGLYERYDYDKISSNAYQFDTKEEAEEWTNPLTEAVQLPVDGE